MNRLRELREEKNKTLNEVSLDLMIPYQTYRNYEIEKRQPKDKETWQKLADYYDVSVPYIMGLSEIRNEINFDDFENSLVSNARDKNAEDISNYLQYLVKSDSFTEAEKSTLLSTINLFMNFILKNQNNLHAVSELRKINISIIELISKDNCSLEEYLESEIKILKKLQQFYLKELNK